MATNEEVIGRIAAFYEKLENRGHFYWKNQEYDKAIVEYEQALQQFIRLAQIMLNDGGGKSDLVSANFQVARLYYAISVCYREQNKYNQALACLNKFINVRNSIETSGVFLNAEQLQECKDFQESANQGIVLVQIRRKSNPQDRSNMEDPIFKSISSMPTSLLELSKQSSSDGCFIATAAYSTPVHPDLDTFRSFRDRTLLSNFLGRGFVRLYYKFSPIIASYLNKNLLMKGFVRKQLERLAEWMRKHEN